MGWKRGESVAWESWESGCGGGEGVPSREGRKKVPKKEKSPKKCFGLLREIDPKVQNFELCFWNFPDEPEKFGVPGNKKSKFWTSQPLYCSKKYQLYLKTFTALSPVTIFTTSTRLYHLRDRKSVV